jgi:ABC-type sugar transport system ATPase subunit
MAEVAFEGVTKRFGDVTAVDRLTLTVADGEFIVLLGPSGCGKTTALRMIAGLETITEGELRIGDRVVNDVEAKDRDISMVFQSYALYPHMTVAKNIESPLLARPMPVGDGPPRKLTKTERDERVRHAAATLELTDLLGRKPGALSGGQRQRVALARAIVSRPKAFLMDEPLSNLDAKLRTQTRVEIVELHRELGSTFVYVTHDQVEAMTMANRIAVMDGGRLLQVGRPQDVYDEPANLFVARFIGSPPMNTITGTVELLQSERWLDMGANGRVRLPDSGPAAGLAEGVKVTIGVRAEHLRATGDDPSALRGEVSAVEWLGHERHVLIRIGDERVVVRQHGDEPVPAAGSTVAVTAETKHLHLFDPATGERLR